MKQYRIRGDVKHVGWSTVEVTSTSKSAAAARLNPLIVGGVTPSHMNRHGEVVKHGVADDDGRKVTVYVGDTAFRLAANEGPKDLAKQVAAYNDVPGPQAAPEPETPDPALHPDVVRAIDKSGSAVLRLGFAIGLLFDNLPDGGVWTAAALTDVVAITETFATDTAAAIERAQDVERHLSKMGLPEGGVASAAAAVVTDTLRTLSGGAS